MVIADTISASRPGARRETLTAYIKRLEKLEEIAHHLKGLKKHMHYKQDAKLRIIVEEDRLDDEKALILLKILRVKLNKK